MSDPIRLLDMDASNSVTSMEQELVSSLNPPSSAQGVVWQRLCGQVGIAASASLVAGAAATKAAAEIGAAHQAGTAAAGIGAGTAGTTTAGASLGVLAKVGVAIALAGPAVGGIIYATQAPAPAGDVRQTAPAVVAPKQPVAAPKENAPAEQEALPAENDKASGATPAEARRATRPGAEPSSALSAENKLFRQARAALHAGQPGSALQTLAALDRRFPGGALRQERDVLRIQALRATGQSTQARKHAERFVAAYPQSPYAAHLRATVLQSP